MLQAEVDGEVPKEEREKYGGEKSGMVSGKKIWFRMGASGYMAGVVRTDRIYPAGFSRQLLFDKFHSEHDRLLLFSDGLNIPVDLYMLEKG